MLSRRQRVVSPNLDLDFSSVHLPSILPTNKKQTVHTISESNLYLQHFFTPVPRLLHSTVCVYKKPIGQNCDAILMYLQGADMGRAEWTHQSAAIHFLCNHRLGDRTHECELQQRKIRSSLLPDMFVLCGRPMYISVLGGQKYKYLTGSTAPLCSSAV